VTVTVAATVAIILHKTSEDDVRRSECQMRYIIAWLLGVPFSIIVLWYLVGHTACGG